MRQPPNSPAPSVEADAWSPPEAFRAPPLLPGGMSMTHGESLMKSMTPKKKEKKSEILPQARPPVGDERESDEVWLGCDPGLKWPKSTFLFEIAKV